MVDRDKRPNHGANCRPESLSGQATRLGDSLSEVMENTILPLQRRIASVVEVWEQLLPPELSVHSTPIAIGRGQLKVQVDSPSYMYHLQICRSDILRELQQQCPRAGIQEIQFVLG
jgi:hypothetical protein